MTSTSPWQCLLELDINRNVVSGDRRALCAAIARGADLRMYTEWLFEEHIAPDLDRPARDDEAGLLEEVIDFRQTICVGDDYAAGVTTQRQAILPMMGFNPNGPARMSYFMYDVDGLQSCANIILDDVPLAAEPGATLTPPPRNDMPKIHRVEQHDIGTTGPSINFIYDMERFRYFVRDDWQLALSHDADGNVLEGSFDALHAAHHAGCDLKVALRDLADGDAHEIITPLGSSWVHTVHGTLEGLTHPLVRVAASRPLRYASGAWDVAWVFVSTMGQAKVRRLDPYRRRFHDAAGRYACRWFVR